MPSDRRPPSPIRRWACACVLVGAGIAAAALATPYAAVYPPVRRRGRLPQRVARELVRFPSADGIDLAGWHRRTPGAAETIIVCHGWPGDMSDVLRLADALGGAGFNAFAFDFRGWGRSGRGPVTLGYREALDVIGAVRFLRTCDPAGARRIGVLGWSMGAAAAILAARETTEIEAVVADSCYARLDREVRHAARRFWGPLAPLAYGAAERLAPRLIGAPLAEVSPLAAVETLAPRPLLIIHGTRDRLVDVEDARRLYCRAGEPKALWLVEGARHAQAARLRPEDYVRRLAAFFDEAFGRCGP